MPLQLNGQSVAPGFASRLDALSRRLEAEGHAPIGVASGKRAKSLQEQIFRDRYVVQWLGSGPFNDVRWWDGDGDGNRERWVRVKAGGTVLPPGDSTHEDPPATGADLSWPYNNRYTAAHARLIQLCEEYGIRWTGRGFSEDWHFDDIWDPYASFANSGSAPFEPEEDDMFTDEDRKLLKQTRDAAASAKAGIWNGGADTIDGQVQRFNYGVLPVVTHTQISQAAQIAALADAIKQIVASGGGDIDLDAVTAAAERGAEKALEGLTLKAV